jgi:hypothetical protein
MFKNRKLFLTGEILDDLPFGTILTLIHVVLVLLISLAIHLKQASQSRREPALYG